MEAQTAEKAAIKLLVCSACLAHTCEHAEDKACDGAEFKLQEFTDARDYEKQRAKARTRAFEKRAEKAVNILRNVNEAADNHGRNSAQHCATLRAMMHTAWILGGESLESFVRSVEALANFKAILQYDSAMLSLCWTGAGMFGGFIFHNSDRTWSLHT